MTKHKITPRIGFFILVSATIALCFIGGPNALWHQQYQTGITYLSIGVVLSVLFFRKRLIFLALAVLAFIVINAGLHAIFRPTLVGWSLTIAAAGLAVWLVTWHTNKHPELQGRDWREIWFPHKPNS